MDSLLVDTDVFSFFCAAIPVAWLIVMTAQSRPVPVIRQCCGVAVRRNPGRMG